MKFWILASLLISSSVWAVPDLTFKAMEMAAFPTKTFVNREGPRTDAVIVWKDGKVHYQRYERGYTPQKKHILWSVSKTITSLMFAVAEYKGLALRTDSICKHDTGIPQEKCKITYGDLVQWTSGLYWVEEYENALEATKSSVLALLYGPGSKDMRQFVLGHRFVGEPGKVWRYSSGDSQLLMAQLPKIFKKSSIHKVFEEELFAPLEISDWTLEVDGAGHGVGASYFHMRPGDLLKLGKLILQRGVFENQRLFDNKWADYMATVHEAFKANPLDSDGVRVGGGSIWLNKFQGSKLSKAPWEKAPEDTMAALGHWGQFLVVVPSQKLIAVRVGDNKDNTYTDVQFINSLFEGSPQ